MDNHGQHVTNQKGLLKPTLQITSFSVLGIFVSFTTQIIVAARFGAVMERDAYFAAIVVPAYVTAVLLGSLTVTFIPIFIQYETKKSKDKAWKVASIFTNLTFVVLFGVSLLGFVFAKGLISITAPGFEGVTLSLTASLLRIILPAIIFSGLTSLLSSIYYAEHRFLRPAIVPFIKAVLMLLLVVLFNRYWGIKSLALGYLIGAVVGFVILVPIFFKDGRYSFSFDFSNEGVRNVIRVMTPLVFAGLFCRAGTLIERMIASTLPTGSISYLGYANRITHILGAIATAGISTTIFPVMARSWAENDLAKVRQYFAKGVRIIMLITFPIAMVFVVLRVPVIQVVFERGAFDHRATVAVANVLAILLVAFIAAGLGNVVGKGFYISQRTKLVAVLNVIEIFVYLFFAYFLSKSFSYIGLAIASSLQFTFGLVVSMYFMKRIYNGIKGREILRGFGEILLSSLVGGGCIYYTFELMPITFSLILRGIIAGGLGIIIYIWLTTYILRVDEASSLRRKVIDKIKGRFSVEKVQSENSKARV